MTLREQLIGDPDTADLEQYLASTPLAFPNSAPMLADDSLMGSQSHNPLGMAPQMSIGSNGMLSIPGDAGYMLSTSTKEASYSSTFTSIDPLALPSPSEPTTSLALLLGDVPTRVRTTMPMSHIKRSANVRAVAVAAKNVPAKKTAKRKAVVAKEEPTACKDGDSATHNLNKEKNEGDCVSVYGGEDDETKRISRMMKNREIARNCRKRKRERMEAFEQEVVHLREENRQLKIQLNKGEEGKDREAARKVKLNQLKELVEACKTNPGESSGSAGNKRSKTSNARSKAGKKGGDDSSGVHTTSASRERKIRVVMKEYAEQYADFGNERRAAIKFHLEALQSLLVPTQVSKMMFWALGQSNEAFYDSDHPESQQKAGGGVWNMICDAVDLTSDQKKKVLSSRGIWHLERENVRKCLNILGELDERAEDNFHSLRQQMDHHMKHTSPVQHAKFLLWIEENQACMHMLNNVWASQTLDNTRIGTSSISASSASAMSHSGTTGMPNVADSWAPRSPSSSSLSFGDDTHEPHYNRAWSPSMNSVGNNSGL